MRYPAEFSSTATYENRYDLDEIDVFMERSGNNPMFLEVSGLPKLLIFSYKLLYLSLY